jgi:hypothetical protein
MISFHTNFSTNKFTNFFRLSNEIFFISFKRFGFDTYAKIKSYDNNFSKIKLYVGKDYHLLRKRLMNHEMSFIILSYKLFSDKKQ